MPPPSLGRAALLLALPLLAAGAAASAAEVWVVTTKGHAMTGAAHANRIIELDAAQRIEAELSARLPDDPARAAALVRQRLQQGGGELQRRIGTAYQGVADAWRLGITAIPAVVVERRYVVYGEPDVLEAVARIDAYRAAEP